MNIFQVLDVNNLRVEHKYNQPVRLFHSVFKMQDLSGACFYANKHAIFLVSLAIIKGDPSGLEMERFPDKFLHAVFVHQTKRLITLLRFNYLTSPY